MFVNSLFERLDTVTLYFSYHSVWESVPYPNRRMKEGSVQCWCFSMRHGHSMIRHGWAGTSCSAGCVWIWQQCLEISRTVTGVHFIKHCDSSYFPSVLEASDGQFPTGSNLIYSNDSEVYASELNKFGFSNLKSHIFLQVYIYFPYSWISWNYLISLKLQGNDQDLPEFRKFP